jgi:hypothetical protein
VNFSDASSKDIGKGENEAASFEAQEGFSCEWIVQDKVLKNEFARSAESNGIEINSRSRHGFF